MPPRADLADIEAKREAAKKIIDLLMEISTLLNTNLDRATMSVCVSMIENGVNPEALATVIRELRREGADPGDTVGDEVAARRPR